jgi:hypothetical protein
MTNFKQHFGVKALVYEDVDKVEVLNNDFSSVFTRTDDLNEPIETREMDSLLSDISAYEYFFHALRFFSIATFVFPSIHNLLFLLFLGMCFFHTVVQFRLKSIPHFRDSKKSYERKIATEAKKNPKSFWKYVNSKLKAKTGVGSLEESDGTKM